MNRKRRRKQFEKERQDNVKQYGAKIADALYAYCENDPYAVKRFKRSGRLIKGAK